MFSMYSELLQLGNVSGKPEAQDREEELKEVSGRALSSQQDAVRHRTRPLWDCRCCLCRPVTWQHSHKNHLQCDTELVDCETAVVVYVGQWPDNRATTITFSATQNSSTVRLPLLSMSASDLTTEPQQSLAVRHRTRPLWDCRCCLCRPVTWHHLVCSSYWPVKKRSLPCNWMVLAIMHNLKFLDHSDPSNNDGQCMCYTSVTSNLVMISCWTLANMHCSNTQQESVTSGTFAWSFFMIWSTCF